MYIVCADPGSRSGICGTVFRPDVYIRLMQANGFVEGMQTASRRKMRTRTGRWRTASDSQAISPMKASIRTDFWICTGPVRATAEKLLFSFTFTAAGMWAETRLREIPQLPLLI